MSFSEEYPLLDEIDCPRDLRRLSESSLPEVANELRQYLIQSVSQSGGHFAAGLGVIELTIALHYVFDTPTDRVVWDVGHQAYPHKILTQRRKHMRSVRKRHGLSGFPRRSESIYDTFGVGHAGTSISAALGMLLGSELMNASRQVLAVIGDGALTAGMALEALNHAGDLNADLLVVLNDNGMSISPNVGALCRNLARISGRQERVGTYQDDSSPIKESVGTEGVSRQTGFLEEFGFHYTGPVEGHDLPTLISAMRQVKLLKGPRLLHVVTCKGKGYLPAEKDPVSYHGVTTFDHRVGLKPQESHRKPPSYTEVFSRWVCDMAAQDPRLVAVTPAMSEGSGLVEFAKRYPDRFFDAGIAEQHALTLAAGLACEGTKPVVAIYSTFLQRAYDQLIHDVAIQNLDVVLAIDRAGLVGADGPTHAGVFDLSYLRCIPNLMIMVPTDENEARDMLFTGFISEGPAAIRYPRDIGIGLASDSKMELIPIGRADIRLQGSSVAILVFGTLLAEAMKAAQELDATLINMRFVCPLDEDAIIKAAARHELLVTVEENVIAGGAGSAVNEVLAANGLMIPVINLGLPARFLDHGARNEMLAECGLNADGIVRTVQSHLHKRMELTYYAGTKS